MNKCCRNLAKEIFKEIKKIGKYKFDYVVEDNIRNLKLRYCKETNVGVPKNLRKLGSVKIIKAARKKEAQG